MIRIAITGNIASGKSTVQKILADLSYAVLDTDEIGHEVLIKFKDELIKLFNDSDITNTDGSISRTKLASVVFKDKELKNKLEKFSHPIIREEIIKFFENNSEKDLCFVGIPLLFEAHMENLFDKIILVYTNDEIREKRLILRNNYTPEQARNRMDCQMPQDKKKELADYIIENNTNLEELNEKVKMLLSIFSERNKTV